MSEESGFFTSIAGDRKYTARFMNEKLNEALQRAEGVLSDVEGELEVTREGNLSVHIAKGSAIKEGIYYKNGEEKSLEISDASLGKKRYDRVAVRIERYRRNMALGILEGEEAASPVPPEYDTENDIGLAKVLVDHSEDPVVVSITDERQMRPVFLTSEHSLDDFKEGEEFGRVLKEKAEALNSGELGISMRQFLYVAKPWESANIQCGLMLEGGSLLLVGRSGTTKLSRSSDGGLTWSEPTGINVDSKVMSLAACENTLLAAGGSPAQIYKSTTWGETWTLAFEDVEKEYMSALLALDSSNGIAVCGEKVYASSNGGSSWALRGSFESSYLISALENMGNGVIIAAGYGGNNIWRSVNSGESWTAVKTIEGNESYAKFIKHIGNGIVLLGYAEGQGKIYRSIDYGLTWDDGREIAECQNYHSILVDEGTIYISVGNALYKSEDNGATWELKYAKANWSDIMVLGKVANGAIVSIGYLGHIYWGYPMEA